VAHEDLKSIVQACLGGPINGFDWQVDPVDFSATAISTEAVLRVHGDAHADSGKVPWEVLVKVLRSARHWPMIEVVPDHVRQGFIETFPWRTEADALTSDLSARLPSGLRTPRVYAVIDLGDDRMALWLEFVRVADVAWDLSRYAHAARLLGRLAARRTLDPVTATPDPQQSAPGSAAGLRGMTAGVLSLAAFPQLSDDAFWRAYLPSLAADPCLREDLLELSRRIPRILDKLDRLPQAIGHGDACPQNLLVPADDPATFVAIDFSWQTPEALGFDLGQLLVGGAHSGQLPVAELPVVHDVVVGAYCEGLADEGLRADPTTVAYGFDAAMLIRNGFTSFPTGMQAAPAPSNPSDVVAARFALIRYLTDRGLALTP
jgi:hypothetical protein